MTFADLVGCSAKELVNKFILLNDDGPIGVAMRGKSIVKPEKNNNNTQSPPKSFLSHKSFSKAKKKANLSEKSFPSKRKSVKRKAGL